MADFGKLNFSTSFNPTSAFPLDARCFFNSLALAKAAAATAEEVGSTNTVYHYGMKLLVDDGTTSKWYTIQRDKTLLEDGTGGDTSNIDLSGYMKESDKVTSIDEQSTDETYPSAKAVYVLFDEYSDGVNALLETIINGKEGTE